MASRLAAEIGLPIRTIVTVDNRTLESQETVSRIALLPSAYLPGFGGVEELTRHLALNLREAGNEIEVWSNRNDAPDRPSVEKMDGILVRRFAFPLPSSHPRTYVPSSTGAFRTLRQLRAAVREFRPEILHVQCFGPNGAYATALSRMTGIPLIISLQGETKMDDFNIFDQSSVFRSALRAGILQAAYVTGCSQFTLADAEQRFGLKPDQGKVIFNGVSLELPLATGVEAGPHEGLGRYVLALGRVVEKKGFDLLLQAWSRIAAQHPNVTLAVGGDGPMLPELRLMADALGVVGQVRFLGRCSREEVAELMRQAELFVMPSRLEPFGIVILEAWRAGTPVVCTSRGGPPEFVEQDVTGLLVDPFDIPELAASIGRVLDDEGLRSAMSANVLRRVTDFSWTAISMEYQRCYEHAIDWKSSQDIARN